MHFLHELRNAASGISPENWPEIAPATPVRPAAVPVEQLWTLFDAQAQSRHLDFAARWLRARDWGFYTIGSAGHESNAAVAMALRPTDPALLHYRSGGFYAARAAQVAGSTPIRDVLTGLAASSDDPISRGRHKVFGHRELAIIPQTSTISSHLPRAVGLAYGLDQRARHDVAGEWPEDAVVVCSFGDASLNHSTAAGALNAAAYSEYRRIPLPLLFVCEDNGLGISTTTPRGWAERSLAGYGMDYVRVSGDDPPALLATCREVADQVRRRRQPSVLHLKTVRYMGHAGSDAEIGYRSSASITSDYTRDPLLATARSLLRAGVSAHEVLQRYELLRESVMSQAETMVEAPRLSQAEQVMAPLTRSRPEEVAAAARASAGDVATTTPLTLAQTINATLQDVMTAYPNAIVFGEDVGAKGGVYGLTRGLRKRFKHRVFDTLLDEQTILGTALGTALAGFLPIPEIQYLAYLHNAEDQLRGEAASLGFFSAGQYGNGMVVRIAGLAYQKGFGGHFHNDNSVAVLRDIPGLVLAVPAHPADAAGLLRTCVGLAVAEQRVCVFLEPIARYHTKDLLEPGDGGWLATYAPETQWEPSQDGPGSVRRHGAGRDLLILTYGNGVYLSLRARRRLQERGIDTTVIDLRWLAPLPGAEIVAAAGDFDRILIVDECRRSGGMAEPMMALLLDNGYPGTVRRVTSRDSYIPLGPAADCVLLSEEDIVATAIEIAATTPAAR